MPICKKCGNSFPNRVTIDGRVRNVCKRKYCLECSPFDKHNTRQLEIDAQRGCICSRCGKHYKYHRRSGNSIKFCSSCLVYRRSRQKKKRAVQYKGGKCQICGYNRADEAFDFHHIDPSTKLFGIGSNYCRKWSDIQKELDKCILLCRNCHAELENGYVTWEDGLVGPGHRAYNSD